MIGNTDECVAIVTRPTSRTRIALVGILLNDYLVQVRLNLELGMWFNITSS